jgi:CHAT domain-containing protein/Flp pilus assembly protein TadD
MGSAASRSVSIAIAAIALSGVARGEVPEHRSPGGLVVETVDTSSPPGRAGIRAGDVLLTWERETNPPANPDSAHGKLASPMDLEEVCIEETQRGRVIIHGTRDGRAASFTIPAGFWDEFQLFRNPVQLPVHPHLEGKDLARYTDGLRRVESGDLDAGTSAWASLASDWTKSSKTLLAAWLWFRLGTTFARANRLSEAQAAFDAAIAAARRSGSKSTARQVLLAQGWVFWLQKDLDHALRALDESRRTGAEVRDPSLLVAEALSEECGMLRQAGRLSEAAEHAREAIALSERVAPGGPTHGEALEDLAISNWELGDFQSAELQARSAIAMLETSRRREAVVRAELTLGATLLDRGDLAAADELHRQMLATAERERPGTLDEAYAAGNLGEVALRRGDLAAAERYLLHDLAIEEKVSPGTADYSACLTSLGDVAMARGDAVAADAYYRRSGDYLALDGLGRLALKRGDLAEASAEFGQALETLENGAPDGFGSATSLEGLGDTAAAGGELDKARRLYLRALALFERLAPGSLACARTLHSLGLLERRMGHVTEAAEYLRRSVDALESQKQKLGGSEELRSLFEASHSAYYRDYVDVLIQLGKKEDAFHTLERSRARALLAMLAERDLVFAGDVPAELERENKLTDKAYDRAQAELQELSGRDLQRQEEILTRLRDLRQKQEQIAERLKKASPRYGELRYPEPLDLMRTLAVVDPGTLLLSYSVGEERSYLFAIAHDARRGPVLTVYTLGVGEKALRESVKSFHKLIEWRDSYPELQVRARSLYDALLKPAEGRLAESTRLLIVPDGPLHTLPWAALIRETDVGRPQYLAEWKPVHTVVSATVYAELKKQRKYPASSEVVIEAFGDPLYPKRPNKVAVVRRGDGAEVDDEDVAGPERDALDPEVRSAFRSGFQLDPLPATRREVNEIVQLYAPRSRAYLGSEATEERAKSIGRGVPLIHFACHALVNERFPLDSALAFTIPEHPIEDQDNGLLQAWEIFEKVRIDADLVTLSACESGLGQEMGGEGLIGLTRAFQYAGARSVLASLWKVEDRATGELMKHFYVYLNEGKSKDEALRQAQIDLVHSASYSQPRDWAAFQINGDWK